MRIRSDAERENLGDGDARDDDHQHPCEEAIWKKAVHVSTQRRSTTRIHATFFLFHSASTVVPSTYPSP